MVGGLNHGFRVRRTTKVLVVVGMDCLGKGPDWSLGGVFGHARATERKACLAGQRYHGSTSKQLFATVDVVAHRLLLMMMKKKKKKMMMLLLMMKGEHYRIQSDQVAQQ